MAPRTFLAAEPFCALFDLEIKVIYHDKLIDYRTERLKIITDFLKESFILYPG